MDDRPWNPNPRRQWIGRGPIAVTFEELFAAYPKCLGGLVVDGHLDPWVVRQCKESWSRNGTRWTYCGVYRDSSMLRGLEPLVNRGLRLTDRAASRSGKTRTIEFTVELPGDPTAWLDARAVAQEDAVKKRELDAEARAATWKAEQEAKAHAAEVAAATEAAQLEEFLKRCQTAGLDVGPNWGCPSPSRLWAQRCDDGTFAVGYSRFNRWLPNKAVTSEETLAKVRAAGLKLFEP